MPTFCLTIFETVLDYAPSSLVTFRKGTMEYVVMGDPIPLARARHGNGKTWDPQKHLKLHWSLMLSNQHDDKPLFEGPLHLFITFFMPKPKTSLKKQLEMENRPHHYKPDLDNLVKWVCDCANGILYKDDSSVASFKCMKIYSDQPRTVIKIFRFEYYACCKCGMLMEEEISLLRLKRKEDLVCKSCIDEVEKYTHEIKEYMKLKKEK
jgi:Holliday junction resolvase RusA-like endonuclease